MGVTTFFPAPHSVALGAVAELVSAQIGRDGLAGLVLNGVAALDDAGPDDLSFFDNPAYADALAGTRAGACLIAPKFAAKVPEHTVPLIVSEPYRAFARIAATLYPDAMRPGSDFASMGVSPIAHVHPAARLERDVVVDPGAVIGPEVEIGAGSVIGAGAVVGAGVKVGRGCSIGAGVTLKHALVGDRVIVHPGARIGQDGFGFAMGAGGHIKVPQLGRVIIQDDVEIGANTTIDRGTTRDTVIGEGTKIDNLVQIAHNVQVGRHCVIVSQVGLSGSCVLEDYVVIAGQAGVMGHIRVGMGAQVGAKSGVMDNVPAGERYAGAPAKPARVVFREIAALARLAARGQKDK